MGFPIDNRPQGNAQENLKSFKSASEAAVQRSPEYGYVKVRGNSDDAQVVDVGKYSGPGGHKWVALKSAVRKHMGLQETTKERNKDTFEAFKRSQSLAGRQLAYIDGALKQAGLDPAAGGRAYGEALLKAMQHLDDSEAIERQLQDLNEYIGRSHGAIDLIRTDPRAQDRVGQEVSKFIKERLDHAGHKSDQVFLDSVIDILDPDNSDNFEANIHDLRARISRDLADVHLTENFKRAFIEESDIDPRKMLEGARDSLVEILTGKIDSIISQRRDDLTLEARSSNKRAFDEIKQQMKQNGLNDEDVKSLLKQFVNDYESGSIRLDDRLRERLNNLSHVQVFRNALMEQERGSSAQIADVIFAGYPLVAAGAEALTEEIGSRIEARLNNRIEFDQFIEELVLADAARDRVASRQMHEGVVESVVPGFRGGDIALTPRNEADIRSTIGTHAQALWGFHQQHGAMPPIDQILQDPIVRPYFVAFAYNEFSTENYEFYVEAQAVLALADQREFEAGFERIVEKYINDTAPRQINIDHAPHQNFFQEGVDKRAVLGEAFGAVRELLTTDVGPRFAKNLASNFGRRPGA